MVDRSFEMLLGIMGIWKAGAAYLPIDPAYPAERIEYMLEDSGVRLLLIQKEAKGKDYKNTVGMIPTLVLDNRELVGCEDGGITVDADPHDLAYIIYTSGSTGNPKGVMIEHGAVFNTLAYSQTQYPVEKNDTFLLKASYSFDGSILELFGWFFGGGKLVILEPGLEKEPIRILAAMEKNKVTHILFVTSMLNVFLDAVEGERSPGMKELKYVYVGGEALGANTASQFHQLAHEAVLVNIYGPTEASVYTTCYTLDGKQDVRKVPIGKPISNMRTYILDHDLRITPIGVAGELYLSGAGLARGYINKPELTEERFIENHFAAGERLYKTGDRARWMGDGNIEYLGRVDHQVKVRGFRIELGEIEAKLLQHGDVKEAIVKAWEDKSGMKSLCAYIAADGGLTAGSMRTYLAGVLPEYMIPSQFIFMDMMPKTPNGKVDRAKLLKPSEDMAADTDYAAPETAMEQKLAMLWQELLGRPRIGIHDNFFEIGGHSLKATMMMLTLKREFNVDISLNEIFNRPKIRDLAGYIEQLDNDAYRSIRPVAEKEYYEVSAGQKRMYILNKMLPGGLEYNVPMSFRITGGLDLERMAKAIDALVKRHESLRTSFHMVDGQPVQRIHEDIKVEIEFSRCDTEEGVKDTVKRIVRPFDLAKAPLIRVGLIEENKDQYLLMIDMHHIIVDGVSTEILFREMIDLYMGRVLPSKKIQYKDFAAWQNEYLKTEAVRKQEKYWLEKLKGELPVLELPTDYPRPAVQSFEGGRVCFKSDGGTAAGLKKIGAENGATLYMVLLATYNILLAKYSNQEDLLVGTPIAGRQHADVQQVVGMFVNTLVMRNQPLGHLTFSEFLKNVKTNALEAYENQEYQFEELVEKVSVDRNPGRNPIFDTVFALQNIDLKDVELNGLTFKITESENKISKFDLTLFAWEKGSDLYFDFEYCVRLFKQSTIERLSEHYLNMLCQIGEGSDPKVCEIDGLSSSEKVKVLKEFHRSCAAPSEYQSLQGVLYAQAAKTPGNTALIQKNEQMNYEEFNKKSNQIARMLIEKGVTRGSIVGILAERSFEMLLGILGILKAGGAYLPLDPQYPAERIEYMVNDSGACLLLIQKDLSERSYRTEATIPTIVLDRKTRLPYEDGDVVIESDPKNLAYIIYTSGSTGKPKGVMIEQGAILNSLAYLQKQYPVQESDTVLLNISYSFDGSVPELFSWFFGGGRLGLLEPGEEKDPFRMLAAIDEYAVAHMVLVPSMLNVLLDAVEQKNIVPMQTVKYVYAGGEALGGNIVDKFYRWIDKAVLVNLYGPTEASVFATDYVLERARDMDIIPIGKPIPNMGVYLLDRHLRPVPIGVTGELCLSGMGLARGYVGKPDLTAKRFVESPFIHGERIYHTGDQARWMPDGNIEYVGRMDDQIKLRGFRIELGEIERTLLMYSGVKDAVVTVREDPAAGKKLTAYLTAYGNMEMDMEDVRRHMEKWLPAYMVPGAFVLLESMPLTVSGKVDRKALPEPDGTAALRKGYVAPKTESEQKLVDIVEQVLNIQGVGMGDNFFHVGGTSLYILQLLSEIEGAFGVELSVTDIMEAPVMMELSRKIECAR